MNQPPDNQPPPANPQPASGRGRPRVPLTELHRRWRNGHRRTVEAHARRSVHALLDEMMVFEPVGIGNPTRLARFVSQYEPELAHLYDDPFFGALALGPPPSPEKLHELRVELFNDAGEQGHIPPGPASRAVTVESMAKAILIAKCQHAYEMAHRRRWERNGSHGTYEPPAMMTDPAGWSERDQAMWRQAQPVIEENRRLWIEAKRAGTTIETWPPPQKVAADRPAGPRPHYRPHPRPVEPDPMPAASPSPPPGRDFQVQPTMKDGRPDPFAPGGLEVFWSGKPQRMSPREEIRPHLEKIGRLDLLEMYSDKIIR